MSSILSYNIDTNLGRLEDGLFKTIFPNHRIMNRINEIINFVKIKNPDIIHFQEGRQVSELNLDSISPLVNAFSDSYEVIVNKYNPSSKSFSYISCFKKSKYKIIDHGLFYLTDTPEKSNAYIQEQEYKVCLKEKMKELSNKWRKINGFEEFERSVAWHIIEDILEKKLLVTVNCHFGVSKEHRFYAPLILNKLIEDLPKKSGTQNIIATGDFNTFQDDGGLEQAKLVNLNDLPVEKYQKDNIEN